MLQVTLMTQWLSYEMRSRALRLAIAPWLLFGHGIPKLMHWWLGVETWGPHINYLPKGIMPGVAALIEFVCPLMIILGFKVRIAATVTAVMLVMSALSSPLPLWMERVYSDGERIPMAIIISKEIVIGIAMGYFALALFGQDEKLWKSKA